MNIASLWEIAIKINIKKLDLGVTIEEFIAFCKDNYVQIIPINSKYLSKYIALPLLHRDPFDRLIIANSLVDNIKILTRDAQIMQYDVPTIW